MIDQSIGTLNEAEALTKGSQTSADEYQLRDRDRMTDFLLNCGGSKTNYTNRLEIWPSTK